MCRSVWNITLPLSLGYVCCVLTSNIHAPVCLFSGVLL